MWTDKCEIVPVINDPQFGTPTEGTAYKTICREEEADKIVSSGMGATTKRVRLYILPPGLNVANGYKIKTLIRGGVQVTETEYRKVSSVFPVGGFSPHHIEVTVE